MQTYAAALAVLSAEGIDPSVTQSRHERERLSDDLLTLYALVRSCVLYCVNAGGSRPEDVFDKLQCMDKVELASLVHYVTSSRTVNVVETVEESMRGPRKEVTPDEWSRLVHVSVPEECLETGPLTASYARKYFSGFDEHVAYAMFAARVVQKSECPRPKQQTDEFLQKIYLYLYRCDMETLQAALFGRGALLHLVRSLLRDTRYELTWARENPGHIVELFADYIKRCSQCWNKEGTTMYAPYIEICQSNGYGKSMLALMSRVHFHLIYVCLRTLDSGQNYATYSSISTEFLGLSTVREFLRFFQAVFENLERSAGDCQDGLDGVLGMLRTAGSGDQAFWDQVERDISYAAGSSRHSASTNNADENVALGKQIDALVLKLSQNYGGKSFLFVIDNARGLVGDKFEEWRRAIRLLKCPLFFALIDTSPRASIDKPPRVQNHSSRIGSAGFKLFPPFFTLPTRGTMDVSDSHCARVIAGEEDYMKLTFNLFDLVQRSRPVFTKQLGRRSPIVKWRTTISRAKDTLTRNHKWASNADCLAAIAACRVPVIPVDMVTSISMVSSFMGTLVAIDEDRRVITVCYVPEPVLSEAAALLTADDDNFARVLDELYHRILIGRLLPSAYIGDVAEVVTELLFLRTMDTINRDRQSWEYMEGRDDVPANILTSDERCMSLPVTVRDLFAKVLPEEPLDTRMGSGLVAFNKWYRVKAEQVTQQLLLTAFEHRCAVTFGLEVEAVDLAIPVLLCPRGSGYFEADASKMTAVYLRVSDMVSWYSEEKQKTFVKKIKDLHSKITTKPAVFAYIQVRPLNYPYKVRAEVVDESVEIYNLSLNSFKFLNTRVYECLSKIATWSQAADFIRAQYSELYDSPTEVNPFCDMIDDVNPGWDLEPAGFDYDIADGPPASVPAKRTGIE